MKANYHKLFLIATVFIATSTCSKSDFLAEKPDKSLVVPNTLEHLQAILDQDLEINGTGAQGVTPQLGESGSDNYYLMDSDYNTFIPSQMQNYYRWIEAPYDGRTVADWERPYKAILYANTALEGLVAIQRTENNSQGYDHIRGQALFHRAHMFHQLAQVFAPAYHPDSDNGDLGIALRLEADINESIERATVKETYERIISDLSSAIPLLGDMPAHKSRPTRQAAYGLLARVYLSMRNYEEAKLYADSCLHIQNYLYDYNLLPNPTANNPFQGNLYNHPINQEIIFFSMMLSDGSQNYPTRNNYALVDSSLYASYDVDDLRRTVFFQARASGFRFKGSYSFSGRLYYFSGLAADEVLLIRAECQARLGNVTDALDDLNTLLVKRWKENTYVPYEGLSSEQALEVVLGERRKQLLFRGLRWTDLRRLNQEGYNATLVRRINGEVYTLPANDPRWVWPLPPEVSIQ